MHFNKTLNQSYKEFQDYLLNNFNWFITGKGLHQYLASSDPRLLTYLKQFNMNKFHIKNKSWKLTYLHHIIAYFFCGGQQAFKNGFVCNSDLVEIHHPSGNTLDNNPDNLVYITTELHDIITSRQRSIKRKIKHFRTKRNRKSLIQNTNIWNKKGEPVKRIYDWAANILIKTICNTSIHFNIPINFKCLGQFILSVKHYWKLNLPDSFIPNIFNNYVPRST
jgi:hypothetical protein